MTKYNHNKKRNTAFIYEVLIKEITKATIKNNTDRKNIAMKIVEKYFSKGSILKKELDIYRSFESLSGVQENIIEKIIIESKKQFKQISRDKVFSTQTCIIQEINKGLGKQSWDTFLPEYKKLATINQVLVQGSSPKTAVMVERKLVNTLSSVKDTKKPLPNINNLTMKKFIDQFNSEYSQNLNEDQKTLLNKYIMSYHDNGLDLKVYLYEEVGRLREVLANHTGETSKNSHKILKVVEKINSYNNRKIDTELISEVIKIQALTGEL